ncbi:MAG: ATP synthase F1 subunit epsilon [Planctomycetes bacterium]|jgi:F-type H+-transporting ATPase subunit epsilon|nr:ATP synthase F1 subunit epsilon [Planctomycetota bacterium]MCL4728835.1 ATP synthase F1 subunit epsilon [Planctomycetota bacterium]
MSNATLQVDIISPEKPVFAGTAKSLVARAHDGEVGILPGHAPMVTRLGIGEVRVTTDGTTTRFAIRQGYLQVADNKVVVLSEDAKAIADLKGVKPEDIERLRKALAESTDAAERAKLQADLDWLLACDALLKG